VKSGFGIGDQAKVEVTLPYRNTAFTPNRAGQGFAEDKLRTWISQRGLLLQKQA
jgi:hypothetical protein